MSKKVKIKANYGVREEAATLWGVKFENVDGEYVAEVEEDLANEMIENGRCAKHEGKASAPAKTKTDVDFASEEAGELHATLVKDKKLTKAEYKKIEGSGADGAITKGDLEDYVASKEAPAKAAKTPPAPAKAAKTPPAPAKAAKK